MRVQADIREMVRNGGCKVTNGRTRLNYVRHGQKLEVTVRNQQALRNMSMQSEVRGMVRNRGGHDQRWRSTVRNRKTWSEIGGH